MESIVKFHYLSILTVLGLLALVGCEKNGKATDGDKEATASAATCKATKGATATDTAGRVKATDDAIMDRGMLVKGCDPTNPNSEPRAWLVQGIEAGSKSKNQDGFLVDENGNILTVEALEGLVSKKMVKVPGTKFYAKCFDLTGDGTGCDLVAEEKVAAQTITITIPDGADVKVVDGGKKAVKKTVTKKPAPVVAPTTPAPVDTTTAKK